jgi:hypothetical protein
MKRKPHTPEQIIDELRQPGAELAGDVLAGAAEAGNSGPGAAAA